METLTLVLPVVAFLAAMALVLAVSGLFAGEREVLRERLAGYGTASVRSMSVSPTGSTILKDRDYGGIPILRGFLNASSFAEKAAVELTAAGVPLRVGEYLLIRWFCGLGLAALAIIFGLIWIFAVPVAVVGFYIPKFYISRRQQQRLRKFEDGLIDALTMMANALRSGSSFLQAIDLVAHELPAPISEEFSQVVAEVGVGATIDEALTNLTKRIKSYDLYLVVTAILVQRQTGGNLSEVLENIAYTIRERNRLLRQVQVLTAQQRFSSMIVGLMPLAILVILSLISPSYHRPFLEVPVGRVMLGIAAVLELLGFYVLRRVAQIEV